jgi:hypothetical protein
LVATRERRTSFSHLARRHCAGGRVVATALGAADGRELGREESTMNQARSFEEDPARQPGETTA